MHMVNRSVKRSRAEQAALPRRQLSVARLEEVVLRVDVGHLADALDRVVQDV